MNYLLDTCTIIWLVAEPAQIPPKTLKKLSHPHAEISISAISVAEIACAYERKRIELDRHWKLWIRYLLKENKWEALPITLPIIEEAWSLPGEFHLDPADRFIVGTARVRHLQVVTADRKILDYPHVESLF